MPFPRSRLQLPQQNPSRGNVKSRLGYSRKPTVVTAIGKSSIKSRLGLGLGKNTATTAAVVRSTQPLIGLTDARQQINLRRTSSGRIAKSGPGISDARAKIEANRQSSKKSGGVVKGISHGSMTLHSGEPIRNLIITTPNAVGGGRDLFRSAVSGMGMGMDHWNSAPPSAYGSVGRFPASSSYSPEPILTRTISNTHTLGDSHYGHSHGGGGGLSGLRSQQTQGRQTFSSSSVAKVAPRFGGSGFRSDYISPKYSEEYMDVDQPVSRPSLKSRLDSPQLKVCVSNLQSTVSVDDVIELFSDVGDLITAKSLGPGMAEAYYRTKGDCLKAVEAYHNRLLDGRPMKVSFEGNRISTNTAKLSNITSLKSASGASSQIKLPKSSSLVKIHPDLSAIHKVLFQPTSSSNATKMLFKGAGE